MHRTLLLKEWKARSESRERGRGWGGSRSGGGLEREVHGVMEEDVFLQMDAAAASLGVSLNVLTSLSTKLNLSVSCKWMMLLRRLGYH